MRIKKKIAAALMGVVAASGALVLAPGTASAANFPVQFDVRSVPSGSGSIWVNNSARCIRVTGSGSYSSGASVAEGAAIGFSWQIGNQCERILLNYRIVYVVVRNPAPNQNFWVRVTSDSGR